MSVVRHSAVGFGALYIVWRAAFTWSGAHPALFGALLLAEIFGLLRLAIELALTSPPSRPPPEVSFRDAPECDVIVVVTDEPASEVRAAVLSARAINSRADVVIVDLDDRHDVAALAQRLELKRVSGRGSPDMGELMTRALVCGRAPYVTILPGDVVVMPDVVDLTVSAFDDPQTAAVVGRIEATNASHSTDYGGYGALRVREQLITPRLDAQNAEPWWHGVSVIRRGALEEVGGFAPGVGRVELASGVRLQVGGWRMADVPVVVARRLASWNGSRHTHLWSRDFYERLSLLRRRDVSWKSGRLTPPMRLIYRQAWIDALRPLYWTTLFAVLLASLLGVGLPLVAPGALFVSFFLVKSALGVIARWRSTRSVGFVPWVTTDLRLLTTDLAVGWRAVSRKPLRSNLVDDAPGERIRPKILLSAQAALILVLVAYGSGAVRAPYGDIAMAVLLASAFWLCVAVHNARSSFRHRQMRQGFRASEELEVLAADSKVAVIGLSPFGVDVVSSTPLQVGQAVRLTIALPRADGSITRFDTATAVRRASPEDGHHVAYLRFAQMNDDEVDLLVEYCAVVAGHHSLRGVENLVGNWSAADLTAPGKPVSRPETDSDIVAESGVGARVAKGNGL